MSLTLKSHSLLYRNKRFTWTEFVVASKKKSVYTSRAGSSTGVRAAALQWIAITQLEVGRRSRTTQLTGAHLSCSLYHQCIFQLCAWMSLIQMIGCHSLLWTNRYFLTQPLLFCTDGSIMPRGTYCRWSDTRRTRNPSETPSACIFHHSMLIQNSVLWFADFYWFAVHLLQSERLWNAFTVLEVIVPVCLSAQVLPSGQT